MNSGHSISSPKWLWTVAVAHGLPPPHVGGDMLRLQDLCYLSCSSGMRPSPYCVAAAVHKSCPTPWLWWMCKPMAPSHHVAMEEAATRMLTARAGPLGAVSWTIPWYRTRLSIFRMQFVIFLQLGDQTFVAYTLIRIAYYCFWCSGFLQKGEMY